MDNCSDCDTLLTEIEKKVRDEYIEKHGKENVDNICSRCGYLKYK